jgi:hypothetical protein
MPKIRTAIARGLVQAAASPAIVVATFALVFLEWIAALALGYQGPFALFEHALGMPPVGTYHDSALASALFGGIGTLLGLLGLVFVRAAVMGTLTVLVVDALKEERSSRVSFSRALVAFPTTLAVNTASVGLYTIALLVVPIVGQFGVLLFVGTLVLGVYLFAFAPVMAYDEGRGMADSLARSIRAARRPGSGNLGFAALYVVPALVLVFLPLEPGSVLGVNPSPQAWLVVLVVNFLHVSMLTALAFRYLSIASEVPDAVPSAEPR